MSSSYLPSVFSTGQTPDDIVQLSRLSELGNPGSGPLPPPPVLSDRRYVPNDNKVPFVLIYAAILALVQAFAYARPLVRYTRSTPSNRSSRRMFFVADDLLLVLSALFFTAYSAMGMYGAIALQWGFRGEDWTLKSVESSYKIFFVTSVLGIASLTMIRLDLLLFCRRANDRLSASANRMCCDILSWFTAVYFFAAIVSKTLVCGSSNVPAAFDIWAFAKARCDGRMIGLGIAAADATLNALVVSVIMITTRADRAQRELGDAKPSALNRPSRMMGSLSMIAALGSIGIVYFVNSPNLTFTSQVYSNLCLDGVVALFIIASTFQVLRRPGISRRARHASFATQGNSIISYPISPGLPSPGLLSPVHSTAPLRPPRTRSVEMDGRSIRGLPSPISEKPPATPRSRGSDGSGVTNFHVDLDAVSVKDVEVASSVVIRNM